MSKSRYNYRASIIKQKPKEFVEATLQKLKKDGIRYIEAQGNLPKGITYNEFQEMMAKEGIEVRFLTMISTKELGGEVQQGSKKSGQGARKPENEPAYKVKNTDFSKDGLIGVDFAGPEAKFSPVGMERFRNIYRVLAEKAKATNSKLVLRPHVGEGNPLPEGNLRLGDTTSPKKTDHRGVANENIKLLVNTLLDMDKKNELSDKIMVRLGHVTHTSLSSSLLSPHDSTQKLI